MLKKTITFEDFNGNSITEDFYFNLSKAEIAEMELSQEDGFGAYLQTIVDSKNGNEIISTFKKIITTALGRRSEDGRRFVKSQEIIDDFLQTDAYSVLFMELITNPEASGTFVSSIVPQDLAKDMAQQMENPETKETPETPAYILENRQPTEMELRKMSREEMQEAFRLKAQRKTESESGTE